MVQGLTCKELTDFLDAYLAGELAPDLRAEFDRHLSECPTCVDYLHGYQLTIQSAARLRLTESDLTVVPEELIDAILATRRHRT